jgi:hypothetical protein
VQQGSGGPDPFIVAAEVDELMVLHGAKRTIPVQRFSKMLPVGSSPESGQRLLEKIPHDRLMDIFNHVAGMDISVGQHQGLFLHDWAETAPGPVDPFRPVLRAQDFLRKDSCELSGRHTFHGSGQPPAYFQNSGDDVPPEMLNLINLQYMLMRKIPFQVRDQDAA